jgi:hypothetical protein
MIKKYKTIQESNDPPWTLNPDEAYYAKMNDFFLMIRKLSGFKVKRGVQKIKDPFGSCSK